MGREGDSTLTVLGRLVEDVISRMDAQQKKIMEELQQSAGAAACTAAATPACTAAITAANAAITADALLMFDCTCFFFSRGWRKVEVLAPVGLWTAFVARIESIRCPAEAKC